MVVGSDPQADRLFHALADATRRDIVRHALGAEHSVSSLARRYPVSFAAVQKHVAVLEGAGLVTKRRHGREQLVTADVHAIRRAARLLDELEQLWRDRIGRIEDLLAADHPTETQRAGDPR
ncbi:MAG: winged helix-turn-helix transcriptional regulator [Acidimicrobiia bacterium]|nr:winged helix-turn-helix transcriptional regulator [Acidimicrobiia bacterium]